ncbi:hypothetical protein [Nocardia sp. NPDC050412]
MSLPLRRVAAHDPQPADPAPIDSAVITAELRRLIHRQGHEYRLLGAVEV